MTFVFSGFSFILNLAHHLASLPRYSADIPLLNRYFYSRPIGRHHLQIGLVSLVVSAIWHVIDIDKKSNGLRFGLCGTPAFG